MEDLRSRLVRPERLTPRLWFSAKYPEPEPEMAYKTPLVTYRRSYVLNALSGTRFQGDDGAVRAKRRSVAAAIARHAAEQQGGGRNQAQHSCRGRMPTRTEIDVGAADPYIVGTLYRRPPW